MKFLGKIFGKIGLWGCCEKCRAALETSFLVRPPVDYDLLLWTLQRSGVLCDRVCPRPNLASTIYGQHNHFALYVKKAGVVCGKCQTSLETVFSLLAVCPDAPITQEELIPLLRRENLICSSCYEAFISNKQI